MNSKQTVDSIAGIIHNWPLAKAIDRSIRSGLDHGHVHLTAGSAWDVFNASLKAAIREIESHPRGKLFRRLLEYGLPNPDDPQKLTSDGQTILSDPECGQCIQFIFSHMINRFKGEMAELLAIAPCLELIQLLQNKSILSATVETYFGESIQERRRVRSGNKKKWSGLAKGADGLIVEQVKTALKPIHKNLNVLGVVEIKSMPIPREKLIKQINHHLERLEGGVKLSEDFWEEKQVILGDPLSIMVIPSTWKISRKWPRKDTESGWELVFSDAQEPPLLTNFEEVQPSQWLVTLDWSKETLEQAAYEMTFWYMSQVGKVIYANKPLPKEWTDMTPEEAGYNSIKMMLYYLMLRYISKYQGQRAIKLYNAYSFGYPLAVEAKDMLWPDDILNRDSKK